MFELQHFDEKKSRWVKSPVTNAQAAELLELAQYPEVPKLLAEMRQAPGLKMTTNEGYLMFSARSRQPSSRQRNAIQKPAREISHTKSKRIPRSSAYPNVLQGKKAP